MQVAIFVLLELLKRSSHPLEILKKDKFRQFGVKLLAVNLGLF